MSKIMGKKKRLRSMKNTPSQRSYTIESKIEKIREAIFKKYSKHPTYVNSSKIKKI